MAANKIDESDEKLKVFVTKLPYQTDEDTLKGHFESCFGPVTDVCIKRDESGNSKGFGFVLFAEEAAAALAIHNTQHHTLQGRQFAVKKVTVKEQVKKIFVGGVSPKITDEELREHFGQYGEIENVETSIDKNTNIRRSFVFVVYTDGAAAHAAAAKGKQEINGFYVDVKKAVPMEQHQQGRGFHAYGFETLAARKSMLEAGIVPHPNPRGMPGSRPPRARGGPRGAPRGGPRGRGRGAAAASAYYDPYAAADPYASAYADPYAVADPYAADPYADPYATETYESDPYAADPYAADYSQDYSGDYSEDASYYPPAPAAGGGKMLGRGGPRGAPRGGAPRGAPRGGAPRGGAGGGFGAPRGGRGGGRGGDRGASRGGGRGAPRGGPRGAPRGGGGRGRGRAAPY